MMEMRFPVKSIKEVYKSGRGPSSSHTMGPEKAARIFKKENPDADQFKVILYGSLAKTGKGHGTDTAIKAALLPTRTQVQFKPDAHIELPHPNTMDFIAYRDSKAYARMRVMSIGGGDLLIEGRPERESPEVYQEHSFTEIALLCKQRNIRLSAYVELCEGEEIRDFLAETWDTMRASIHDGLSVTGILPGGLKVERKAQFLFNRRHMDESETTRENRIVCAYAFAVAEQNADNKIVVTAPTCGSAGVLPSVLKYMQERRHFSDKEILKALAVGGLIGNLIKTNASVSGAECGCQAEIGSACAMASGALCELFGMGIDQIEYAAEVALEHYLGLTCDPVCGLVQIPCIERNAVAAMRAINALSLANFLASTRKVSFDTIVETMYETGRDLPKSYRETSEGGLAKLYR